jgi:lysophospholipase L1-like esterase
MSTYRNIFLLVISLLFQVDNLCAQQKPRFWENIQEFKRQDSESFPKKNAILFIGSSSIRLWEDAQSSFPKHVIINRGFGGSMLPEVEIYANDIIFPYQPRQIVLYCGENDLTLPGINADSVLQRFQSLFYTIRGRLNNVDLVFISLKPSPKREHLMPEMVRANKMIKDFLKDKKKTSFVDIYSLMLDENGSPKKDIFVDDMLHMNAKGYSIWAKALRPYLVK